MELVEVSPKCMDALHGFCSQIFPRDLDLCLDGRISRYGTIFPKPGGHADVYMGIFERRDVAIKVVRPFKLKPEKLLRRLWREYQTWSCLSHPNILPCLGYSYDFSMDPHQLPSLISPWMNNGIIASYLEKNPEVDRIKLIIDVANGLSYLHTRELAIVHGDLRAGNILVSDQGAACLADFGLSRALQVERQEQTEVMTSSSSEVAGSARWMAPELFATNARPGVHCDTWAYGMTVLEILSGKHPYFSLRNEAMVIFEIRKGKLPTRPHDPNVLDDKMWAICELCWSRVPSARPSMKDVAFMITNGCRDDLPSAHRISEQPLSPDDDAMSHVFTNSITRSSSSTSRSFPPSAIASTPASFSNFLNLSSTPQTPSPYDSEPNTKYRCCERCKQIKIRCIFNFPTSHTCQGCRIAGSECVIRSRNSFTSSQHAELILLHQLRQKDAIISRLLEQYGPFKHATPLTLTASVPGVPSMVRTTNVGAVNVAGDGVHVPISPCRDAYVAQDDTYDNGDSVYNEDPWDADSADSTSTIYLHMLPASAGPLGVMASLSIEMHYAPNCNLTADFMGDEDPAPEDTDTECGIANRKYFQPGLAADLALRRLFNKYQRPPSILAKGLISQEEAQKLFDVFFEFINPIVSLLDPYLHTCAAVYERCPFLFTVVCAVALRHAPPRQGLYTLAMRFAKASAAVALIEGAKSVELVQGYLLLSMYGLPARSWETDRAWCYCGLATRIAMDIGLNKPSTAMTESMSDKQARELRNRERTWLICFNTDRSSAIQFGKPFGIHDGAFAENAWMWCDKPYSQPYDLHLVMYMELLRIMSRFHEQVYVHGKLNRNCDLATVTGATESELSTWHDDITLRYWDQSDVHDPGSVLRKQSIPFIENYMRLVMYSYGFQDAWKRRGVELVDLFFTKCLETASAVLRHVVNVLAPAGFLGHAPDSDFVTVGFCAAFLLKMLRPEFEVLSDEIQRMRIIGLMNDLIAVLASPQVELDESHPSKLYAKFLAFQLYSVVQVVSPDVDRVKVGMDK